MSRPAINRAAEQHRDLDNRADLPGKARPRGRRRPVEVIEVSGALRDFLNERIAASKAGELSNKTFWQIIDEALAEGAARGKATEPRPS